MKAPLRRLRPPPTSTSKSWQLAMMSTSGARRGAGAGAQAPQSSHALAMMLATGLAAVTAGAVSSCSVSNKNDKEEESNASVTEGRAAAPSSVTSKLSVETIMGSSSRAVTASSIPSLRPLHSNQMLLATSSSTSLLATCDASAERSASLAAAARLSGGKASPFSVKAQPMARDGKKVADVDVVSLKSTSTTELKKSTSMERSKVEHIHNNNSVEGNGNQSNDDKRKNNTQDNNSNQSSSSQLPTDSTVDDSYPTFTPYHNSLLKKYLTPTLWTHLSTLQTSHGTTIEDIIRAGLALPIGANPPRRVGVLVGDAECYTVFRELLDPIISEYHGIENYEEWADPELPMESYFMNKASVSDGSGASVQVPLPDHDDHDHDYGVIKSSGADEDSDENDDSSFLLDEEDDVFVEDVALPSSSAAPTSTSQSTSTTASARRVATIASKRKGQQLRRHPTIINNPRLVTNREADPEGKYIVSTRIRVARSLDGVKFPTTMSRADRRRVQRLVGECTQHFQAPNLAHGTYLPVLGMTNDQNLDLIERHILFDNPNEWTIASGLGRDWPDGRALYANVADLQSSTPDFMIWVNEEDHLRIMCLRSGGDIQGVFTTLMNGVRELERELRKQGWHFAYDPRLGWLTSCPTNVGTTMRASVHVRLTNLGRLPGFFRLVERLKLEARGKYGETDRHYTGVFDISNAERLGKSEVHLINVMVEGVAKLIELERRLESGETIDIDDIAPRET